MNNPKRRYAAAVAVLALLVAGCGSGTPVADVAMVSGQSGVSADGYSKPGAPVRLDYRVPISVDPGTTIEIEVTLSLESEVEELVVTTSGGDGVELLDASRHAFAGGKPGQSHSITLQAIAWESGNRFVNVFAETRYDGRSMRRSFAVPLAVSGTDTAANKGQGEMKTMPDGERVMSLPAEEDKSGD